MVPVLDYKRAYPIFRRDLGYAGGRSAPREDVFRTLRSSGTRTWTDEVQGPEWSTDVVKEGEGGLRRWVHGGVLPFRSVHKLPGESVGSGLRE